MRRGGWRGGDGLASVVHLRFLRSEFQTRRTRRSTKLAKRDSFTLFRRRPDRGIVRMRGPIRRRPAVIEAGARIDSLGLMDESDAILDRTGDNAKIAADAFGLVDDELALAVDHRPDRLMRRILADNVAAPAFDAEILVDLGLGDVIEVEILPVDEAADRAAAEIVDPLIALGGHEILQARNHLLDDLESIGHRRRA